MALQQSMTFSADTGEIVGPIQKMAQVMDQLKRTADNVGASISKLTLSADTFKVKVTGSSDAVDKFNTSIAQSSGFLNPVIKSLTEVTSKTDEFYNAIKRIVALEKEEAEGKRKLASAIADMDAKREKALANIDKERQKVDDLAQKQRALDAKTRERTSTKLAGEAVAGGLVTQFEPKTAQTQQAIRNISNLIAAGKVSISEFQEVLSSVQSKANTVFTGTKGVVQRNLQALSQTFGVEAGSIKQHIQSITISWGGLLRLFQVQILHQVFGALSNEFQRSVAGAAEFQTKISEIQTISQSNQQTVQAWTQQLEALSNAFGKSQTDIAQAAYETLSNQIAKGAESTRFLQSALDFALTTNSSATNSVNLLSSAINSYQLTVNDAERVSAIFFKTIDLGRIKAHELGNTFGRVGPLAAELGVGLEETAAALATITRVGVPASEAITFLNNIFTALLKPSSEMTATLQKFGVTSGEQAIQTFTFSGVLHKLAEEAKLGSTHVAELFRNIRGLKGINALTRELKGFDKDLAALGEQANREFNKAKDIMKDTDAFKFHQLKQEISNFFTNEMGNQAVKGLIRLKEIVGDVRVPLTVLVELVKAGTLAFTAWRLSLVTIAPITAGIQALVPIFKDLISQVRQLGKSTETWKQALSDPNLGANLANAFAIGVAIEQTIEAIVRSIEQNRERRQKSLQEQQRVRASDNTREFLLNETHKTRGVIAALEQQRQAQLQTLIAARIASREAAQDTNEAYINTIDQLKISLSGFLDTIRDKIASIKSSISTLSSIIRSARGDFEENFRSLGESLFVGGATPRDQIVEAERKIAGMRQRIQEIAQRSLRDISSADNEGLSFIKDDLALVRRLYDEINKLIGKEVQLAQKDTGAAATSETLRKKFDAFIKAQSDFDQFQTRNVDKLFKPDQLLKKQQEQQNLLTKAIKAQQDLVRETQTSSGLEASAIQRIIALTQERLRLDQQVVDAAKQRRTELQAELEQQQEVLKQAAQDVAKIEKFSLLDSSGKVKEQFKTDPQKAITELRELGDKIRRNFPEGLSVDLKFKIEEDLAKQLQLLRDQISQQIAVGNLGADALVEGTANFSARIAEAAAAAKKNLDELDASLDNINRKLDSLSKAASSPGLGTTGLLPDFVTEGLTSFNKAGGVKTPLVQSREARTAFLEFSAAVKTTIAELNNLNKQDLGLANVSDKIQQAEEQFRQASIKLQLAFKAASIKPEDVISPGTTQSVKTTINEITTEFKNLSILRDRALKASQQVAGLQEGGKEQAGINIDARIKELTKQSDQLKKKAESVNFSDPADVAGLQQIKNKITEINREFSNLVQKTQTPLDQILTKPQFDIFVDIQRQLNVLDEQLRLRQQQQIIESQQKLQQGAADGANQMGAAVGISIQTMDSVFGYANSQVEQLRQNLLSLNNIVISPQIAIGGGGDGAVQGFAHGGFVNMFRPRGFDTIPAMLRPGEIVMNTDVSRKFKSQLLALNAGKTPSYFSRGGEVTNVGGISITVQGGSTSEQTVRNIGRGLNRQIRRGVLKLNTK